MGTIGQQVRVAIIRECTSPKLGNVHPHANFAGMSYATFCKAAVAIGASVDRLPRDRGIGSAEIGVGQCCLAMVQSMVDTVGTNTSLGTILLFAPLVVASFREEAIEQVLADLNYDDSKLVYRAIQLANPGGMGKSSKMDVSESPPESLLEAMRFASRYDDIALQYVSDFHLVKRWACRIAELVLLQASKRNGLGNSSSDDDESFNQVIRRVQVEILAERIDSLIVRKAGSGLANDVQIRSQALLRSIQSDSDWESSWRDLDSWMRAQRSSEGKQLANPGTTADLIAGALFYCMQKKLCRVPYC